MKDVWCPGNRLFTVWRSGNYLRSLTAASASMQLLDLAPLSCSITKQSISVKLFHSLVFWRRPNCCLEHTSVKTRLFQNISARPGEIQSCVLQTGFLTPASYSVFSLQTFFCVLFYTWPRPKHLKHVLGGKHFSRFRRGLRKTKHKTYVYIFA